VSGERPRLPGAYLWDLGRFRKVLAEPGLADTLDLSHAWILHGADVLTFFRMLVPQLPLVHLHANRGASDKHLTLGEGTTDMARAYAILREVALVLTKVTGPEGLRASQE
jgi:sugar phosphate isomerase/epimerase